MVPSVSGSPSPMETILAGMVHLFRCSFLSFSLSQPCPRSEPPQWFWDSFSPRTQTPATDEGKGENEELPAPGHVFILLSLLHLLFNAKVFAKDILSLCYISAFCTVYSPNPFLNRFLTRRYGHTLLAGPGRLDRGFGIPLYRSLWGK